MGPPVIWVLGIIKLYCIKEVWWRSVTYECYYSQVRFRCAPAICHKTQQDFVARDISTLHVLQSLCLNISENSQASKFFTFLNRKFDNLVKKQRTTLLNSDLYIEFITISKTTSFPADFAILTFSSSENTRLHQCIDAGSQYTKKEVLNDTLPFFWYSKAQI